MEGGCQNFVLAEESTGVRHGAEGNCTAKVDQSGQLHAENPAHIANVLLFSTPVNDGASRKEQEGLEERVTVQMEHAHGHPARR